MRKIHLLFFCFAIFSCSEANRTENLLYKIERLQSENDSLKNEIQQMQILKDSLLNTGTEQDNYWFNPGYDGSHLTELGIENPQNALKDSLRQRTDLIPLEEVLGGTMRFGNMQLLGQKWIIADYSDGHIQGRSIFLYSVNNQGELNFEILDSAEY